LPPSPPAPPLLKGTLDLLVLKALTLGPMHGFEIVSWLEQRSNGSVGVDDGALYYALHRMEERGWIESEWRLTSNNRKARYYRVRAAGRAHLKTEGALLEKYARALVDILALRTS
jgi:PadR family transcriptional regulator, regulatory protein PadR